MSLVMRSTRMVYWGLCEYREEMYSSEHKEQRYCSPGCASLARRIPWDEHFFDEPTADGAYILGFLVADGHVRKDSPTILLGQTDPDILWRMIQVLRFEGKPFKWSSGFGVRLTSEHAWRLITERYGIPSGCKSYTVRMPAMPRELRPHLVRGLFDGDGSMGVYDGKVRVSMYSGSEGLVDDFRQAVIEDAALTEGRKAWCPKGSRKDGGPSGAWEVTWGGGGGGNARRFARYVYGAERYVYGSDLYLRRKKERFDAIFMPWHDCDWLWEQCVQEGRLYVDLAQEWGVDSRAIAKQLTKTEWGSLLIREQQAWVRRERAPLERERRKARQQAYLDGLTVDDLRLTISQAHPLA